MLKQNPNSLGLETFNISEKYLAAALVKFLFSCSFPSPCTAPFFLKERCCSRVYLLKCLSVRAKNNSVTAFRNPGCWLWSWWKYLDIGKTSLIMMGVLACPYLHWSVRCLAVFTNTMGTNSFLPPGHLNGLRCLNATMLLSSQVPQNPLIYLLLEHSGHIYICN